MPARFEGVHRTVNLRLNTACVDVSAYIDWMVCVHVHMLIHPRSVSYHTAWLATQ